MLKQCPNRFFYCCPVGVIPIDKVPSYAGLLYVKNDSTIIEMKKAPLLHKYKVDPSRSFKKMYRNYEFHMRKQLFRA